jgi:hypothetical protein
VSRSMSDRLRSMFARPQRVFVTPGGQELADWARAHPGGAVEAVISARACHELLAEPGLPLADLPAVRDYAEAQFGHYFGAAAARFALAPWRLGASSGMSAGASALHGLDLALPEGVRLHAARPAWSVWLAALPAATRAGSGRLLWREGEVAVLMTLDQGRLSSLQSRRITELSELGEGAWLAQGGPESDLTPQPGPAMPAPDFVQRPRRSPGAWPLAAVGAVVFATAFLSAGQSHIAQKEARAERDRLAAAKPTATPRAAARPEPDNRSAAEARALLAAPWEATLTQVEAAGAATPGVAWLGLEASAARGELRLEGLTEDKLAALRLTEQLAQAPGWRQVLLSRFSAAEPGLSGQRFEINAKPGGRP